MMLFERQCPACSRPARTICDQCARLLQPAGVVHVAGAQWSKAALAYDDIAAALIIAGKDCGRRDILRHLAQMLVPAVPPLAQVITWVPANSRRRRERGFDQGKVLARALSSATGVPARQLLRRSPGPTQKGQDRTGRLEGPSLTATNAIVDCVVLIDDVMTTGASLTSATAVLTASGVENVWTLTLAAVA